MHGSVSHNLSPRCGGCSQCVHGDKLKTMSMAIPGPVSRTYFSQRLRLNFVDWGNTEAPPLLLIHGGLDHCRNWDWVAERLRSDWHIIAPDLRGHGDSAWSPDGNYSVAAHLYDLSQLIDQQKLEPVTIISHSFGAHLSLRYAGIFPDKVKKLIAIEGVFPPRAQIAEEMKTDVAERLRNWIANERKMAGRQPRRYQTIEDAFRRMREENKRLTAVQARHLTQHGMHQNEDGTFSWKFDNYVRSRAPHDVSGEELEELWRNITCPTLHVYGTDSWMEDPQSGGRMGLFQNAQLAKFDGAGHWVHHDQLDAFITTVQEFLQEQ